MLAVSCTEECFCEMWSLGVRKADEGDGGGRCGMWENRTAPPSALGDLNHVTTTLSICSPKPVFLITYSVKRKPKVQKIICWVQVVPGALYTACM